MIDKKYYQEAIDVQDACNGMGVIRSLKEIAVKIEKDRRLNDTGVKSHPVLVMYADKLADLCQARYQPTLSMSTDPESINIAKIMGIVRDYLIEQKACEGTEAFNQHPLIRTLAYLLYKESGAESPLVLNDAYEECHKVSKEV